MLEHSCYLWVGLDADADAIASVATLWYAALRGPHAP